MLCMHIYYFILNYKIIENYEILEQNLISIILLLYIFIPTMILYINKNECRYGIIKYVQNKI